jgi:hypothetical protein
VQQIVGVLSPTIIGELLAEISAALPAPSATPAAGPGDPVGEILEGPPATSSSAVEDDQEEGAGEIA